MTEILCLFISFKQPSEPNAYYFEMQPNSGHHRSSVLRWSSQYFRYFLGLNRTLRKLVQKFMLLIFLSADYSSFFRKVIFLIYRIFFCNKTLSSCFILPKFQVNKEYPNIQNSNPVINSNHGGRRSPREVSKRGVFCKDIMETNNQQ